MKQTQQLGLAGAGGGTHNPWVVVPVIILLVFVFTVVALSIWRDRR